MNLVIVIRLNGIYILCIDFKKETYEKNIIDFTACSPLIWAEQDHSDMHDHSHEGHLHDTMVDGKNLDVDPDRFDKFISNIPIC